MSESVEFYGGPMDGKLMMVPDGTERMKFPSIPPLPVGQWPPPEMAHCETAIYIREKRSNRMIYQGTI